MKTEESISEENIFSAALTRDSAEREAFIAEACKGDDAMHARIVGLLRAQGRLGGFMENLPAGSPETVRLTLPEEGPGARIDRYKLLQKLGEGGCGIVYMAEQDEPVKRRVALKVIKLGMDTKSVVARFAAERQALAMMDHPNIAKVLDAGATETGRPYFVMELVRGLKITEFCDQNRLTTRERLQLFIQVCQAVQHAHQKGIIHRDLKPSNILVTLHDPGSPPVPKVIDFGIAKATQGRLTDHTLFTAFEQFLGTPAYMSPEQTLMTVLDVDTRSDIYSLGVLLYELLTGCTPFDPQELLAAGFEEMRRTIREKEPVPPSTRLSTLMAGEQATAAKYRQAEPPGLIHLVRGDLDWIVMKCLEKDRARRYETANALAMDLKRHLQSEPVLARPPSKLYEFQRTVRRHKAGFAAGAAIMLALACGAVVSWREAVRAQRAEEQMRRTSYVFDMHSAQQALVEGNSDRARRLLARYVPSGHGPDLTGWEWRYLAQQSKSEATGSLHRHLRWVGDVCFLSDGQLLSVGMDRRIVWWDWSRRVPNLELTNVAPVWRHALSPNGRTVALVGPFSGETNLYLLDSATHQMRKLPVSLPGTRLSVAFSPSGELAIADAGHVLRWSDNRPVPVLSFDPAKGDPDQVCFSPDGKRIAVATPDGRIDVWSWPNGLPLKSWQAHAAGLHVFNALLFSPDGRWLLSSGAQTDRKVCAWDPETGEAKATLEGHRHVASAAGVLGMAFSPDGKWVATAGADQTVRVWDTRSWGMQKVFLGHSDYVTAVAWSPDGSHLVSGDATGELLIWDWPPGEGAIEPVTFSDESTMWISPGCDFMVRMIPNQPDLVETWDPRRLQRLGTLRRPPLFFSAVALLPGARVATGEMNGDVRIWQSGGESDVRELRHAHAGADPVWALCTSTDGRILVSRTASLVRVFSLPSLTPVTEFRYLAGSPGQALIAVAPNGARLAVSTAEDRLDVRELPRGEISASWQADPFGLRCIAFSSDGKWVATGSDVGTGAIWSLPGPKRVGVLEGNPVAVTALAFSPDASRLAAGLLDGTVKLYDTKSGGEVLTLRKHSKAIQGLGFVQDGSDLVSVSADALCVWQAPGLRDIEDTVERLKQLPKIPR